MKSFSLGLLIATCLLLAAPVFAQSATMTQANIPFEFVIGTQTFPAGHYSVEFTSAQGVIALRDSKGHMSTYMVKSTAQADTGVQPKWTFAENGDTHYLLSVAFADNRVAELPAWNNKHMASTKETAYKQVEAEGTK